MPKSRPPYPAAFRQQMVELVRSGRTPGELAREFEPSAEAIRNWVLGYASPLEFERLHAAVAVDGARPVEALQAPTSQVEIGLPVTTDTVTGFAAGA